MTAFLDGGQLGHLIATYGYAMIFAVVMLESSGLPLPGETVLVCASIYAGSGRSLDISLVIASAAGGAIMGDNIGYWDRTTLRSRPAGQVRSSGPN